MLGEPSATQVRVRLTPSGTGDEWEVIMSAIAGGGGGDKRQDSDSPQGRERGAYQ